MKKQEKNTQLTASIKRLDTNFRMANRWLHLRQNKKTLASFFEDNLIESVAIYGMGALGERLYEELRDSEIVVPYAIDRNAKFIKQSSRNKIEELEILAPNHETFPDVETIVVTPVQDYWLIVEMLEIKTDATILSLEDIIEYCMAGE